MGFFLFLEELGYIWFIKPLSSATLENVSMGFFKGPKS